MRVTLADLVILSAMFIAFLFVLAFRLSLWKRIRFRGFRNWPSAQATVQTCNYHEYIETRGPRFSAEISYSYIVQGAYYPGYLRAYFFHESELDEFRAEYAV